MNALAVTLLIVAGPTPPVSAVAGAPDGRIVQGSQAGVVIRGPKKDDEQRLAIDLENVCALAFSPDGKCLAVAGGTPAETGSVNIFAWPTRKQVGQLKGHTDLVHAVAWLPDSSGLATASADRTVRLWTRAGKSLATLKGHSGPVLAAAFTPDGQFLCTGGADQTIRVWNVKERKLVRSLNNHLGPVTALAFRPGTTAANRPYLASAGADRTVRVWQPTIGRLVRIIRHPAPVSHLAWSAQGDFLFSAAHDDCLRKIDGASDEVLETKKRAAGRITSLVVLPDGKLMSGHASGATTSD